jgi:hypothetical protein
MQFPTSFTRITLALEKILHRSIGVQVAKMKWSSILQLEKSLYLADEPIYTIWFPALDCTRAAALQITPQNMQYVK